MHAVINIHTHRPNTSTWSPHIPVGHRGVAPIRWTAKPRRPPASASTLQGGCSDGCCYGAAVVFTGPQIIRSRQWDVNCDPRRRCRKYGGSRLVPRRQGCCWRYADGDAIVRGVDARVPSQRQDNPRRIVNRHDGARTIATVLTN